MITILCNVMPGYCWVTDHVLERAVAVRKMVA